MKRKLTFILVLLVAVIGVSSATAQVSTDSISVTATNNGVFVLNIIQTTYAFGAVDANGTANATGTEPLTGARNLADTGATYTSTDITTFEVRSAPSRTVRIFNASTTSTLQWGTADRLSIRIPTTGLSVGSESCGFKTFIQTGDPGAALCTTGGLVRNFAAGNGNNKATGKINFELAVNDTDPTGSNTWTVVLTATGS